MIILHRVYNQYETLKIKLYMTAHIEGNAKNSLNNLTSLRTWNNLLLLIDMLPLLHFSAANTHT